jgi:serine/threonine-protein kinase
MVRENPAPMSFAVDAQLLGQEAKYRDGLEMADRCIREEPRSDSCWSQRSDIDDWRGDCTAFEADTRQYAFLAPNEPEAREQLADAIASNGASAAAVREALGAPSDFIFYRWFVPPQFALASLFEGDFAEAARLARDALARMGSDRSLDDRFHSALAAMRALTEAGDMTTAADVAESFLARESAWLDTDKEKDETHAIVRHSMLVATMVRGGRMSRAEGALRQAEAFKALMARGRDGLVAWARAYDVVTAEDARIAVAALDREGISPSAHVFVEQVDADPSNPASLAARALVLAGRGAPAREILERTLTSCRVVTFARELVLDHLYLGVLDERDGKKAAACGHYTKVLERWGHAKPRSVTADEARARATRLGCAP